MEAQQAHRQETTESAFVPTRPIGGQQSDDPLVKAFFSDLIFVEATREGIRAHQAGEVGIFLDDLRREISESHTDDKAAGY